jgi:DNA-binding MarR family transcriptional regulator
MGTPADDFAGSELAVRLLAASRALVDELRLRLAAAGHPGLRPAHGFIFQTLGADGATASEIAGRLGITKQAARLIVDELIGLGYVARGADPRDGRRRPVYLTGRGNRALQASTEIFDAVRDELAGDVGPGALAGGMRLLGAIDARYGPAGLRPVW